VCHPSTSFENHHDNGALLHDLSIVMEHKQEIGHKEPVNTEEEVTFFHDFVAGGVAGSASVVVGHPFDTIKVRTLVAILSIIAVARAAPNFKHIYSSVPLLFIVVIIKITNRFEYKQLQNPSPFFPPQLRMAAPLRCFGAWGHLFRRHVSLTR
jgi:hypothetical protein